MTFPRVAKTPEDIGAFDKRIILQSRLKVRNTFGSNDISWPTVDTVWANWASASGAEKFVDNQEQPKTGPVIYIRWLASIDETWRVVDVESGKTYGIMHIAEVGRRHFLELVLKGPGEV